MSGQPGGLSELIAQQLTRQMGGTGADANATNTGQNVNPASTGSRVESRTTPRFCVRYLASPHVHPQRVKPVLFKSTHRLLLRLKNPPAFLPTLCWAKLDTKPAGADSKSRSRVVTRRTTCLASKVVGWTGKTADVTTTEFVNGVAEKRSPLERCTTLTPTLSKITPA